MVSHEMTTNRPSELQGTKKPRKATASKPTDICTFHLNVSSLKAGPISAAQPFTNPLTLCLALDTIQYLDLTDNLQVQDRLFLLHPEENELDPALDPVFMELPTSSSDLDESSEGIEAPQIRVDKDVRSLLDQLTNQKVLELLEPIDPEGSGPQTRPIGILLSDKEIAKRCKYCEIWEQRTDQERLSVCSRCKSAWWAHSQESHNRLLKELLRFCVEQCQMLSWKNGKPTPHKKLCKMLAERHASTGAAT
jgi:hypothetical protein